MKNKEFFNLDHAINYMLECVIMFNGEPIYITGVDRGRHKKNFTLSFQNVGDVNKEQKSILSDNSGIDMNPVPLGFNSILDSLTANKNPVDLGYFSRMPARRWKIGLTSRSLVIEDAKPRSTYHRAREYGPNGYIVSPSLRNTILGRYPNYNQAFKAANDFPGLGVAFSRRFAIDKDNLYYKTYNIPVGITKNDHVILDEDFSHLQEVLTEDFKNAYR